MKIRTATAVVLAGIVFTALGAGAFDMPAHEGLRLAVIAAGSALLVGAGGAALLVALRRRPLGVQIMVVALSCVAAVAAGATVAADAMFLSRHDLDILLVILSASGTIGVLAAYLLGSRISAASRSLEAVARRIGRGDLRPGDPLPSTGEFASIGRELLAMGTRLDESMARERALDASRRELTAWVSHDLRTPLAGIRAIAEALEDGLIEDPATVTRYHRTLRVETDRLSNLVDELFELSVIHAGALELQMERVSLGDLVSDAISAASASAAAQGVRVEGQLNGTAPVLELSPPQVARVLRNLLDNAIRHTPSDGSVWVEAGPDGDGGGAYVSVADECGGIPDSDLARVFDPAFRGQAARTPGQGGGGLGLAIARGLVEAHHGQISVRNEGPGCRFVVRLPSSQSR